jgi:hypothetical protein
MSRFSFLIWVLAITILFAIVRTGAQTAPKSNEEQQAVVLVSLFPPIYPPLAKQARITGDVEVMVSVRRDGSLEAAVAVGGHPLLKQAALNSANQSQFECLTCSQDVTSQRYVYTFQLGPTEYCSQGPVAPKTGQAQQSYPQVTQSMNHVILIDQPIGTCDMPKKALFRAARCLYLWRCGFRYAL